MGFLAAWARFRIRREDGAGLDFLMWFVSSIGRITVSALASELKGAFFGLRYLVPFLNQGQRSCCLGMTI